MDLDKDKIVTQDELNEPAPIDQVEERVDAEMKKLEGEAKRQVNASWMLQKASSLIGRRFPSERLLDSSFQQWRRR